jgi:hypothetical protein
VWVLLAIAVASASAGQIVYQHGQEIWVMNDDGSNQHPLLNASQVPGMSSIGPDVYPGGGTSLAFEGTTLAYLAPASGPPGACGINCTGTYVLSGGVLARITGEATPCGAPAWCGSFSTSPRWTANGSIAYEASIYTWEYSCFFFPCSWSFSSAQNEIDVVAATAGAGVGTTWKRQFTGTSTSDGAPDPADPSKLSYIGPLVNCEHECLYPLYVSTGSGTDTPVIYDDNLIHAAWSPDGTHFADVEGGGERGIWTYGSEEAKAGKSFVWALEDPIQTGKDPGNNPFDVTFRDVSWIGSSELVFSAEDNLWTIPASCGVAGAPSKPCHFPQDATQLTFDGTTPSPDGEPSWTSATTPIVSAPASSSGTGASGAGTSTGSTGHGPPSSAPAAGTASVGTVHAQGSAIAVTLSCGGASSSACAEVVQLIVVETRKGSRIVAVQASKQKTKKRTVVVGSGSTTLSGGQTKLLKLTLNGTGKALLAKYRTLHVGLKVTQTVGSTVRTIKTASLTLKAPKTHR